MGHPVVCVERAKAVVCYRKRYPTLPQKTAARMGHPALSIGARLWK